jgi:hypothetical protein
VQRDSIFILKGDIAHFKHKVLRSFAAFLPHTTLATPPPGPELYHLSWHVFLTCIDLQVKGMRAVHIHIGRRCWCVPVPQGDDLSISGQQQTCAEHGFTQPIQVSILWNVAGDFYELVFEDKPASKQSATPFFMYSLCIGSGCNSIC